MSEPMVAPYGSWKSPITTEMVVAKFTGLGELKPVGDALYWLESRSLEGGRQVVVRRAADGTTMDLTPPGFNVRTRVHEYGGGAWLIVEDAGAVPAGGSLYFANFDDQRLYVQSPPPAPAQPLTPAPAATMRYADLVLDETRARLICVREDHSAAGQPVNTIAAVDLSTGESRVLVSGSDFYSSPRLSPPSGGRKRLAWLSWNHPNMPWDGTELWVAELDADGEPAGAERVAGGEDESIFQPEWSPEGELHFVSDRTGWWNLYRRRDGKFEALCADGGGVWRAAVGVRHVRPTRSCQTGGSLRAYASRRARGSLALLDPDDGQLRRRSHAPFTEITGSARPRRAALFFGGGSPTEPSAVVLLDLASGADRGAAAVETCAIDPGYISRPEPIEFPTEDGLTAYGFYYPPRNRDYAGPPGSRPPLLVMSHGGPTSHRPARCDWASSTGPAGASRCWT